MLPTIEKQFVYCVERLGSHVVPLMACPEQAAVLKLRLLRTFSHVNLTLMDSLNVTHWAFNCSPLSAVVLTTADNIDLGCKQQIIVGFFLC